MKKPNTDPMSNERLFQLIEWAGLTTHAFAQKIGMKNSANLYRIIRDKEGISLSLAAQIVSAYPSISYEWLIAGEGDMEIKKPKDEEGYLDIPIFADVDMLMKVTDNAMYPTIPDGCTAIAKKQNSTTIIYGRAYIIEFDDISIVRIIRENSISDEFLTLVAADKLNYDNITIGKDRIKNLYLVKGIINNF